MKPFNFALQFNSNKALTFDIQDIPSYFLKSGRIFIYNAENLCVSRFFISLFC